MDTQLHDCALVEVPMTSISCFSYLRFNSILIAKQNGKIPEENESTPVRKIVSGLDGVCVCDALLFAARVAEWAILTVYDLLFCFVDI